MMDELSVVNVVGGGSINRELDLRQLSRDFPGGTVEYNPESFAAVVVKYKNPKATIMIYSSGKYSLAGASSVEDAQTINDKFIGSLTNLLNSTLKDRKFEVRYVVVTADIGVALDLNSALIILGSNNTEYEPEQFPALFYRPSKEEWFCSIFSSGKIVINGCRNLDEAKLAYQSVKGKLSSIL